MIILHAFDGGEFNAYLSLPPDTEMTPVSRTIGADRVVDEMVFEFTYTIKMDWMLPGVAPTGKHVKVPLVAGQFAG
jgi:carboxymethylenebutenolidase